MGNGCENKAGESSKSRRLGMLSGMPLSQLDPETVIRARLSPRVTQQVCSDTIGPTLGQKAHTPCPSPDQDQEGKRQAQTYLLTHL